MSENQNQNILSLSERDLAVAAYLLMLGLPMGGIPPIIALVLAYIKRPESEDYLETHYTYQIRTFWIGLLASAISLLLCVILIGFVLLLAVFVWWIARVIYGLNILSKNQPIADPESLFFG